MKERILLVDDDWDVRKTLSMLLDHEGYVVAEAANGSEALSLAEQTPCDLILLDINMPGMNGFEVCQQLKSNQDTKNLPIIFLTASGDSRDHVNAFDIGAADYINKTFNKAELLARVRTQLKVSALLQALKEANSQLEVKKAELEDDLQAAARIQETLLPKSLQTFPEIKIAWKFLPSQIVAGDLFNIVELDETHLGIYMLDVSGHGVSSAMVTVSLAQTLHASNNKILRNSKGPTEPAAVLSALNKLYPIERFGKYFTMVYMVLNRKTGELCYSAAGHPPPIHASGGEEIRVLTKGGTITGFKELTPFEQETINLAPNDRMILYTDGLCDHLIDHKNEQEVLLSVVEQYKRGPLDALVEGVIADMLRGTNTEELSDDVSILSIEYTPTRTV